MLNFTSQTPSQDSLNKYPLPCMMTVMAITPISSVFKTILPNRNNRDRELIIIHKKLDNSIFLLEKRQENIDINLSSLGLTQKPGLFTRIGRFISLSPETGFSH